MGESVKTPICDFVKGYVGRDFVRLHMPGHKGKGFLGVEKLDITEIDGADVLYHSDGIIRESESIASRLFGTGKTVYSAEGSSLCIRAMLYLAALHGKSQGKERPVIVAARNAHKVFMTASALLDIDIRWLYPDENDDNGIVSCRISTQGLDKMLSCMSEKPCAVYITSPDYLGNVADISGLSEVCHRYGVLLIVDNAHGAYLAFLPDGGMMHPMQCGADMCCDSAHKTLPVLTGGAYLHISKSADKLLYDSAYKAMAMFASTSPSYLILQSLDNANKYIAEEYKSKLKGAVEAVESLSERLLDCGYNLIGNEPLKLTIATKRFGYTGYEMCELLASQGFVCEFCDPDYIVMMFTPENISFCEKLGDVLCSIPQRPAITESAPCIGKPVVAMSPRQAVFSACEMLPVEDCEKRILASANVSCPPAIPIVVCGEIIDDAAIRLLKYYGISQCDVVKEI